MNKVDTIISELKTFIEPAKANSLMLFFKTGKGEYGEGDKFLGITVPHIRIVAKNNIDANMEDIEVMINSEWHEIRMCSLLIMVLQFKKTNEEHRKELFQFYLHHTNKINNWDLVDLSAPAIVGTYLLDKDRDILYRLADSNLLWDNRIAIVSTFALIKGRQLDDTYCLAKKMMNHPQDLMHKAIGWMLREAGKRDFDRLYDFVYDNCKLMPRTMLRYAIEKFPEETRKYILKK
nr:DNA alkylation repair protein [Prevotella sp.]